MKPLRWGFFGAGKCTHDFVSALKLLQPEHHQAVAIAARDSRKSEKFAEELGIEQAYGSYLELAQSTNIDIIYIGTVNSEHFHQAKLALVHGKHVLCEKPVCINRVQVEELMDIAKAHELFFMEGFWTFFFPATQQLLEEIKLGNIGKVVHMTVEIGNKFYHLDRFSRNDIGGGTLLNHGVYGLMFAHQIFGQPTNISASGLISGSGTDTSVAITLTYRDTAQMASVICSCKADMPGELRVIGTQGSLKLPFPFWAPTRLDTPNGTIQFNLPQYQDDKVNHNIKFNNLNSSGFVYEAEAVRRCIIEGCLESPVIGWKASRSVMGVADEIRRQIGVIFPDDKKCATMANGNGHRV